MRFAEVIHDGTTHHSAVSWWDGHAHCLCGKTIPAGKYREPWIWGDVNCDDCNKARKAKAKS